MSRRAPLTNGMATRKKGAFVVCSNANWLMQSAFVLQQAINSDPDGVLDYYFFGNFDVSRENLAFLFDERVIKINFEDVLQGFDFRVRSHIPAESFLRFFAIDHLAERYERVIYADGDVYLSWGSWAELLQLPVADQALAAVAARSVWYNAENARYGRRYRAALNPNLNDKYLNSGVLLINSDIFRQQNITARVLDYFRDHAPLCHFGDQSALNAVLAGQWDELSPSWNWQVSAHNFPLLPDFNPRVIHFTGEEKPWNDRYGLYGTALAGLAQFVADRGIPALAAAYRRVILESPFVAEHRKERIAEWTDNKEIKFSLMNKYLRRDDFSDRLAGPFFSDLPSGFGAAPR